MELKIKRLCIGVLLVALVFSQEKTSTVFLIRHAEKVNDSSKNPRLSAKGKKRSRRLISLLRDANIVAIYSTSFRRTRETVEPIARLLKLKIKNYLPFRTGMLAADIKNNYKGKSVLIVGHSNTVPKTILDLGGKNIQHINENEYSDLFILTLDKNEDTSQVHLHY